MFEEQSIRLLREKWKTIQELAEELFAIFQTRGLIKHDGSLQLTPTDSEVPLQITLPNTPGETGPGVTITRGDTNITISPEGVIITSGGTSTTLGSGGTDLTRIVGLEDAPSQAPFVVMGYVVSGSGSSYQVELFTAGQSIGVVSVTQLLIDADEVIPEGTPVYVVGQPVTANGVTTATYVMQVPVWL